MSVTTTVLFGVSVTFGLKKIKMPNIKNTKGEIIAGTGAKLTELQSNFIERVAEEGLENAPKIAKQLNYTSYYRDRRNTSTAFYREFMALVDAEQKSIDSAKGMNLHKLVQIREIAMRNGDLKLAMEAMKIINDMQGYKAPTKVEQTKIDITATIDLTASNDEEETDYIDI